MFSKGFESERISSSESLQNESPYSKALKIAKSNPSTDEQPKQVDKFTDDMLVVSLLILFTLIFLIAEPIRLDFLALSILVLLVILEPWTKISAEEGLSGFSSTATITVLAMFILSEGVRQTGFVQILSERIAQYTIGSEIRQLAAVSGLSGMVAGIINNTPVVAIFIPMVTNLAQRAKTSPSKLLIPLSYASMLGGTLTLLGTSTNLLASDVSERLLGRPFSMFEFTHLGVVVLVVGLIYLLTFGRRLIPVRIDPEEELTEEYEMEDFLTELVIEESSPLIGHNLNEMLSTVEFDLDLVQIIREGKQLDEPLSDVRFRKGDHLVIRTDRKTLLKVMEEEGLRLLPEIYISKEQLEEPVKRQKLIEVVIPNGSLLEGETLKTVNFLERYDAIVLALRRGGKLTHTRMHEFLFKAGDVLLLLVTETTLNRLRNNRNFIVAREMERSDYRRELMPVALGIVLGVVALAAADIIPIVVSALAGVVLMVVTGCVKPGEVYGSVDWQVIFLLAGLIPLGLAMEKTGTAQYVAALLLTTTEFLPHIVILGVFYLFTAMLTNVISNNASVVLMIPVAVDAATQIGANPFAFVLAVTFAASTAFMSPIGYQTNLMVYSSGGYRFRDFVIAGTPLQLMLAVVTPLGISVIWGI